MTARKENIRLNKGELWLFFLGNFTVRHVSFCLNSLNEESPQRGIKNICGQVEEFVMICESGGIWEHSSCVSSSVNYSTFISEFSCCSCECAEKATGRGISSISIEVSSPTEHRPVRPTHVQGLFNPLQTTGHYRRLLPELSLHPTSQLSNLLTSICCATIRGTCNLTAPVPQ